MSVCRGKGAWRKRSEGRLRPNLACRLTWPDTFMAPHQERRIRVPRIFSLTMPMAAYIVIDTTGIDPAAVTWSGRRSGKRHSPRTVLAAWHELGRPNPWPWNAIIREVGSPASAPTRLCICGCGRPVARSNQRYHKRSCYERERRAKAAVR